MHANHGQQEASHRGRHCCSTAWCHAYEEIPSRDNWPEWANHMQSMWTCCHFISEGTSHHEQQEACHVASSSVEGNLSTPLSLPWSTMITGTPNVPTTPVMSHTVSATAPQKQVISIRSAAYGQSLPRVTQPRCQAARALYLLCLDQVLYRRL